MTKGSRQNRCVTSGEAIGSKGWMGFRRTVLRRLGYDLGWRYLRAMLSGVVALLEYGVLAFQPYPVVATSNPGLPLQKNNQLRTGADKGNPTV